MDIANLIKMVRGLINVENKPAMDVFVAPPKDPKDDIDLLIKMLIEMGMDSPVRQPPTPGPPGDAYGTPGNQGV